MQSRWTGPRGSSFTPARSSLATTIFALVFLMLPGLLADRAAAAPSAPRLDPALAHASEQGAQALGRLAATQGNEGMLDLVLRGAFDVDVLKAAGAEIGTVVDARGNGRPGAPEALLATARVPVAALPLLLEVPGLETVEAGAQLEFLLDVTTPEINADSAWGVIEPPYVPPYPGHTGAGVVLGVIDTGLDVDHADFRKANGQTRVKYFWDQVTGGAPPAGFSYGTEWTEAQINAGTDNARDGDPKSHGTHIAGVSAANGRATAGGYPAYRYVGVAPEADLIIVRTSGIAPKVIDGVNYVFQRAASLQKDAVVLLAVGNQIGAHDGSADLDVALSQLTGRGRIVVAAAGNDGNRAIHAASDIEVGDIDEFDLTVPSFIGTDRTLTVSAWHEPSSAFEIRVTSPANYRTGWIEPHVDSGTIPTSDGGIRISNDNQSSSKGALHAFIYLFEDNDIPVADGVWKIEMRRLATEEGRVDLWIAGTTITPAPYFSTYVDLTTLVSSPATGDSIIAAGAYTTKTHWIAQNGCGYGYSGAPDYGALAPFSSPGPRRDGVVCPEICGPGFGVVSALASTGSQVAAYYIVDDGLHFIDKGTSAAAAEVAGTIAVVLEEYPHLSPLQVRSQLRMRARLDEFTATVPNESWGYGKVNLIALPEAAVPEDPGIADLRLLVPRPNPSHALSEVSFTLDPAALASARGPVFLMIHDVNGREIARLPVDPHSAGRELVWNGRDAGGRAVAPGVYFGRLRAEQALSRWRIVRIE